MDSKTNDMSDLIFLKLKNFMIALFYLWSLHCDALGCAQQNKPAVSRSEGTVIQRMVGNGIQTTEFNGNAQQAVDNGDALRCTFDQQCCWQNVISPVNWLKASGVPEQIKVRRSFGTTEFPNGDCLISSSDKARPKTDTSDLVSCRIICAGSNIVLKARHWLSKGVTLMGCIVESATSEVKNCKPWPGSSGVLDTIVLPGGQDIQLLIRAADFIAPAGSVAMLDDISVDFQPCSVTSTSTPTFSTEGQTTVTSSVTSACTKIVCSFEQGSPCSYTDAMSAGLGVGNANVPWRVSGAPFENKLTGIPVQAEGRRFAASYLSPGDKAALITNVDYPADYVVRLNSYRATEGVNLFGCCDDVSVCPFSTTEQVQISDYRTWKTASITCPSGTKKIIFYAVNSGRNQGAVGLDNIQLLVPSSSTPDQASVSACRK